MKNQHINDIILKLSDDKELLRQFLDMVSELNGKETASDAPAAPAKTVSVYCIPRHTEDGVAYYHPLVVPKVAMVSDNPDDYEMLADTDVISLQEKAAQMVAMYRMVYHNEPVIVSCSEETYEKLCAMLHELIAKIFGEVDAFAERIGTMVSGFDKVGVLTQVMSQMTVSGASLTRAMDICTDTHEYVEDSEPDYEDEDDYDDYDDDDYDDDYDDEDEDDYVICPNCGDTVVLGDDELEQGSVHCPNCGEVIHIDED